MKKEVASKQIKWRVNDLPEKSILVKVNAAWKDLSGKLPAPKIATLLAQREIDTEDKMKRFFKPSLNDLHDPFLMKDMDAAVSRIEKAMADEQKVLVYGDYDVDGTTSVALVYSVLKSLGITAGYYIPNRYSEGYGISEKGIDYANENDFDLVIALDCGIRAIDKIEYAKSLGIDFIICDHHTPGEKNPDAVAVLDPKRSDCNYPFKELSGCGVGFKLMQALLQSLGKDVSELYEYLDLLAVSIGADIVPIIGENRILASFGLQKVFDNGRPGITKLFASAKFSRTKDVSISDLVFLVAPRINAAGRIDSGETAVKLLTTESEEEADQLSELLEQTNTTRRSLDKETTGEALTMLANDEEAEVSFSTVVWKDGWHKGVIGIVASRLIEKYYRPTIVFSLEDGMATGSARSVEGFNIHTALQACDHCIEQFGGHPMAAGLSVREENLETFRKSFDEAVSEMILEEHSTQEIQVDLELELDEITAKFYNLLKFFAPFGPGNMRPVFKSSNVVASPKTRSVGSDKSHLKLEITHDATLLGGIGFGLGHLAKDLAAGQPFSMVYTLEENVFRGQKTLQLNVKDIHLG